MHNLDEILDEVRRKYYCSTFLKRPTISWSEDYITDCFGEYTFYNNHITISRTLNTPDVSKEMVASVIYHESLHQDFQEHDNAFYEKASLFPNYHALGKKLDAFSAKIHSELEYKAGYNQFTKGKQKIVYIVLDRNEDYSDAFFFRNTAMLVDFNVKVNFDLCNTESFFYVFLVKANQNYYIVGWCTNGTLYKKQQKIKHKKFGDYDFSFQLESDYAGTHIIPLNCCDYAIPEELLPKELLENGCCIFDIKNPDIQPEIEYIESYCEGYYKIGFDLKTIDCISDFEEIPMGKMKTFSKTGYAKVCLANAIYHREPTYDNLVNRGVAKYEGWLLEAALEDFILANQMNGNDYDTVYDIIKIAVLVSKFDVARQYVERYRSKLKEDTLLRNLYKEIDK